MGFGEWGVPVDGMEVVVPADGMGVAVLADGVAVGRLAGGVAVGGSPGRGDRDSGVGRSPWWVNHTWEAGRELWRERENFMGKQENKSNIYLRGPARGA